MKEVRKYTIHIECFKADGSMYHLSYDGNRQIKRGYTETEWYIDTLEEAKVALRRFIKEMNKQRDIHRFQPFIYEVSDFDDNGRARGSALTLLCDFMVRGCKHTYDCQMCWLAFMPREISGGAKELQTFDGWTVDFRLRQFRKVPIDALPEFVEFDSEQGQEISARMHEQALKV